MSYEHSPSWKENLAAAAVHTHADQDDGGKGYHPHMRPYLCENPKCPHGYVSGLYGKGVTDGQMVCFECSSNSEKLKCHKAKVMKEQGYEEDEILAYLNNRTSSMIYPCEPPPPPRKQRHEQQE
jgi:hypothetical protein